MLAFSVVSLMVMLAEASWKDKVKDILAEGTSTLQTAESTPTPWQSVAPNGALVEIKPTLVRGVWRDTEPTSASESTTENDKIDNSVWSDCHETKYAIPGIPICAPSNGSNLLRWDSYAITWNPLAFNGSETVDIVLRYEGNNKTRGKIITDSGPIPNAQGFYTLKIEEDWLKNEWNQSALVIISPSKTVTSHPAPFMGPIVFLQYDENGEPPVDLEEEERKANARRFGIGIPVALFGVIFLIWIWFCVNRRIMRLSALKFGKTRRIGRRGKKGRSVKYNVLGQEDEGDDDLEMSNVHDKQPRKRHD